MDRKEFLKTISLATAGSVFSFNGLSTSVMNHLVDLPINCSNVSDRVVVIIRLAGANDGLNMAIPISQYATYAALRPNIRIKETGTGSYIRLDNTLPANKLTGLHPNMTGFKSLYDSGKLTLVTGVGYPQPNYSHFKSENTMFSGKDGNNNVDTNDGIFGRYLAEVYPGLSGQPTPANPDPLAIQFGNANPCLFYGHTHENSIEYNAFGFQEALFSSLQRTLPSQSEYTDLMQYIKSIEAGMDIYYNRVQTVFNNGFNSGTTYPTTSLGKQLKTVARLIKGGSKTKIFQVTVGGYDTHANQVQSGSSHLGNHANLMADLSNCALAFQNDIQALGFADKIMTVSFSEFGRRVRENGSLGTDHGDLSSFFIIGNTAQPGVLNAHPIFTNTTDFFYHQNQIKTDYRQIFTTLLQDWLGASTQVLTNAGLSGFSKIPLVKSSANATTGNCLTNTILNCENTVTAVPLIVDNNWTYYGLTGTTDYLFAIEHFPVNGNTGAFTAQIVFKKLCNTSNNVHKVADPLTKEGMFLAGYYWNISILTGATNSFVNLRFFQDNVINSEVSATAYDFYTSNGGSNISPLLYFKSNSILNLPNNIRNDAKGLTIDCMPLTVQSVGTFTTKNYVQFNTINNIHQSGGGSFVKVTNLNENSFLTPLEATPLQGTLRYNAAVDKFEGFNGTSWEPLH